MVVKLNVGGTVFTTLPATLANAPVLHAMVERWEPDGDDGDYFLDRDPVIFGKFLGFLRGSREWSSELSLEAHYWGLDPPESERKTTLGDVERAVTRVADSVGTELKALQTELQALAADVVRMLNLEVREEHVIDRLKRVWDERDYALKQKLHDFSQNRQYYNGTFTFDADLAFSVLKLDLPRVYDQYVNRETLQALARICNEHGISSRDLRDFSAQA